MEFLRQYLGHHSPETRYQYVTDLPGLRNRSRPNIEKINRQMQQLAVWLQLLNNPRRLHELSFDFVPDFRPDGTAVGASGLLCDAQELSRHDALQSHLASLEARLRDSE
ncbi:MULTISPECIES: hypothetical protein [unclassified Caballeronia]|uniref:hypothetical protein n=1 Tax=unclassified Caballeronia TaxID=2646786 RepID=UPI0020279F62|nr:MULTISPECIES: hypothetical protein [unclassified Caballeronia]MDR5765831.1 hypothetical protein [Caballeronia sp. LZ028]